MPGSSGGMSLAASEQSEQTRKVLRYVAEAVRRIEERHQAANKLEGVFTLELLTLRFDYHYMLCCYGLSFSCV